MRLVTLMVTVAVMYGCWDERTPAGDAGAADSSLAPYCYSPEMRCAPDGVQLNCARCPATTSCYAGECL